ncbi:hypothetical protein FGO68_gene12109 [Halteria grandinella]|uniref:Uncharacterized protein n=1 Tax=Halteria grandinella TaxID=5974 RepID=A0A8J8SU54_HALGN|nr:hypothetical protein FGO68_gene12109 [Halteria grandinella]
MNQQVRERNKCFWVHRQPIQWNVKFINYHESQLYLNYMQQLSLEKMVIAAQKIAQKEKFNGQWERLAEIFQQRLQIYKNGANLTVGECKPTIGIEFYPAIKNEKDLVNKIMWLHLYLPQVFFNEAQFYEFSTALDDRNIFDRRNVGYYCFNLVPYLE